MDCFPAQDKSAASTEDALRHFIGAHKVKRLYSDCSLELEAACKTLRITQDTSTPNRPETNGVAERAVRRVCEGTRAVLLQSGLPHRWWTEAAKCYCVLRNVCEPATTTNATTPYQLRRNTDFKGKTIPFGALIQYKPSSKVEVKLLSKFGSKMLPVIFVGYHLHSGGRWSGDYLLVDAAAYQKRLDGSRIPVHRVKEIHYVGPATFPIKDGTIESLPEEAAEAAVPLGETPSVLEHALPGGWDHILAEVPPAGTRDSADDELKDVWEDRPFMIVRIHNLPRRAMFDITTCDDPLPIPLNHVDVKSTR